ncbi:uncharacterized protein LAESUDRAFT_764881 [Laetiporus sulphureus 93-53]|uniref:Uncharacterized protein n=1 Tax=Laetiporus sulphureus 93-53 TaxID=1314785 RepID=A0A165B3E0_9APHY|nr:uncharacterized protein LAESUDRAFT_764881 [Laetiporus sulphureus 93-53]KZT00147.1 hypothetical protein LAESUDRAFT_764881 [Laetiporus sulphureus 93-53]
MPVDDDEDDDIDDDVREPKPEAEGGDECPSAETSDRHSNRSYPISSSSTTSGSGCRAQNIAGAYPRMLQLVGQHLRSLIRLAPSNTDFPEREDQLATQQTPP